MAPTRDASCDASDGRAAPGSRQRLPRSAHTTARAVLVIEHDGEPVVSPRVIGLFEAIHARGSVRRAATELGMGYRHAIAWIRRAEHALRRPLVVRRAGGSAGGGAGLTPDGIALVRRYRAAGRRLARIAASAERGIIHHHDDNGGYGGSS